MMAMTTSSSMRVNAADPTESDFTEGNEDNEGGSEASDVRLKAAVREAAD